MTYVVAATWRAKEGEESEIRRLLEAFVPLARAEPACRAFVASVSTEDPRAFLLYEEYEDEAAFEAHRTTDHFARYVLDGAVPLLESRDRAFYVTLD